MELKPALKRVGAEVVKEAASETSITMYFRVDPRHGHKWVDTVSAFLLGSIGKPYKVDLSKYFYADGKAQMVKYNWRLLLNGEQPVQGLTLLAQCAVEASVVHAPQLDSFPLVGRVQYAFDPAKGKLKGAHEGESGDYLVNVAAGSGVPVPARS